MIYPMKKEERNGKGRESKLQGDSDPGVFPGETYATNLTVD